MKEFEYGMGGLQEDDIEVLREKFKSFNNIVEFGPGNSTKVFIELGIESIHCCEYQNKWLRVSKNTFGNRVYHYRFNNKIDFSIPELEDKAFDAAFVDAPVGTKKGKVFKEYKGRSRINTLLWSIKRCNYVYLHDAKRKGERRSLNYLEKLGCSYSVIDTEKGIAEIKPC